MRSERDSPPWAKTIAELESLSDDELREQHDALLIEHGGAVIGVSYYLGELARRDIATRERRMELLTWAILTLTIVNVVAVIVSVL
jgi:hypothetical protein